MNNSGFSRKGDRESFLPISNLESAQVSRGDSNHPLALEIQRLPWFCFSQLKNGDKVRIITEQTHYALEIIDAQHRIVDVQSIFGPPDSFNGKAILLGSVFKKTGDAESDTISLRTTQLAVGFSAVLFTGEGLLRLPVTQIVWLNGRQVLPDLKNIPNREP